VDGRWSSPLSVSAPPPRLDGGLRFRISPHAPPTKTCTLLAIRRFGMILKLQIDFSKPGIEVLKLRIEVFKLQIEVLKLQIEVLKLPIDDLKLGIEILKLQFDDLKL
jgi:hypothetical protein